MNDRIQKVLDILKQNLPEGTKISVEEIAKANGVTRTGIIIRHPAMDLAPVFYIDAYDDMPEKQMALSILESYAKVLKQNSSFINLLNYDEVKENLMPRLYNIKMNRDLLRSIPYIPFLDLAVTVIVMSESDGEIHHTTVSKNLLAVWKKPYAEVLKQALTNLAKHGTTILSLNDLLKGMLDCGDIWNDLNMYIMTGVPIPCSYGAAHMLNTSKLLEFAMQHESDIIVIPSSVHEVILIPIGNADKQDIERLDQIVKDANKMSVDRDDWLSDHVYIYRILSGWDNYFAE